MPASPLARPRSNRTCVSLVRTTAFSTNRRVREIGLTAAIVAQGRVFGAAVGFRLVRDTNPRLGLAWWCNNMGVFATLANVDWGSEFALRVRAAR